MASSGTAIDSPGVCWVRRVIEGSVWFLDSERETQIRDWIKRHVPCLLDNDEHIMKRSRGTRVAAADGLVLKESTARASRSSIRFGLRRSAAERAARLSVRLAMAGIPTARPVAYCIERRLGFRRRDFLISEEITGRCRLTEWLRNHTLDDHARKDVVSRWGELMGAFHSAGFSNRDMKDANVLVTGSTGSLQFFVVDLDGVRRVRLFTRRRVLRDIWSIVRSLRKNNWPDELCRAWLLEAYNSSVPDRLRIDVLPAEFPGWPV